MDERLYYEFFYFQIHNKEKGFEKKKSQKTLGRCDKIYIKKIYFTHEKEEKRGNSYMFCFVNDWCLNVRDMDE